MGLIEPVVLYGLAVALIMGGFYLERNHRLGLLVPIWILLALAFKDIHLLPSTLGLSTQFGMLIIVTGLHAPPALASYGEILSAKRPYYDLPRAYRLYNNPRWIQSLGSRASNRERLRFAVFVVCKGVVVITLRALMNHILGPYLSSYKLHEFLPSKDLMVTKLLLCQYTSREIALRAYVSVIWIQETFVSLTLCHIVLCIVFVLILRIDEPGEWPTLFHTPRKAYTVQRFWASFWHSLVTPSALAWARFAVARVPYIRRQSALAKALVAFIVFSISGMAHSLVGWRLGDVALARDVYFFWGNFAVIAVEISASKMAEKMMTSPSRCLRSRAMRKCVRLLGHVWVLFFFFLTIPHLLLPKLYHAIRARR